MKRLVQRFATEDISSEVLVARFSTDGQLVATGSSDGNVRVFHPRTGAPLYTLTAGAVDAMPITAIRWRPLTGGKTKNVAIVASADGIIKHWHVTSQRVLARIVCPDQVYCLDYRADGEVFAAAGKDKAVRIYDDATGVNSVTCRSGGFDIIGHSNRIFSVKYDPRDPNRIASGGWDNTVIMWDARSGSPAASIYGPHICGDAIDIYDHLLLTGSWRPEKQLQLYDMRMLRTNEPVVDIPWTGSVSGSGASAALASRLASKGAPALIYAACFSPSGTLIAAGGSGSNEAKVFDCTGTLKAAIAVPDTEADARSKGMTYTAPFLTGTVAGLSRSVYSVAFDPDDGLAVCGGDFFVAFDINGGGGGGGGGGGVGGDSTSASAATASGAVASSVAVGGASVSAAGVSGDDAGVVRQSKKLTSDDEAAILAAYGGEGEGVGGEEGEDEDEATAASGARSAGGAATPGARFGISEPHSHT